MSAITGIVPGLIPASPPPTAGHLHATSGDFAAQLEALMEQQPKAASDTNTGIEFSKHARARLESRGIDLSDHDLQQLSGAVDRLAERGAQESLVMLDDNAFIVGVPKRTVITAMSSTEAMGNVFTNIDSTIVLR